jgi:hypothetical protein
MVLLVKNVNWEELKQKIRRQESFIDEHGAECKEISLGKVADLTPSGKHRDFGRPARNLIEQGSYKGYIRSSKLLVCPVDKDEQEDNDWWKDLIEEGKKHEVYIRPSSDSNRSFIMAGIKMKDRPHLNIK